MEVNFLGNTIECDSKQEGYFAWWLNDLYEAGLIRRAVYQPEPFELTHDGADYEAKLSIEWTEVKPRSEKHRTKALIRTSPGRNDLIYTPDFYVRWEPEALGLITYVDGGRYGKLPPLFSRDKHSYIEVKGSRFGKAQSEEATRVRIAMTYIAHGEVAEVVRPESLFKKTFYPSRYFRNDNDTGIRRKKSGSSDKLIPVSLHKGVKTFDEFISEMREKNCF